MIFFFVFAFIKHVFDAFIKHILVHIFNICFYAVNIIRFGVHLLQIFPEAFVEYLHRIIQLV